MAERVVSPGVFTREKDLSFLPQGIDTIGAALIGPTNEGPAFVTPNAFLSGMKFSPYFGVSHLKGTLGEYQSDMVIGGSLETAVNPFLAVAIGLNYFNVNLPDSIETHSWNDFRGTKLSKLGIEIGPKVFILSKNNLRPYLGVNIGLNQMSLKKDTGINEMGYYSNPMKVSFDSLF